MPRQMALTSGHHNDSRTTLVRLLYEYPWLRKMSHGIATVSIRFSYGELRLTPIAYVILRCTTFPVRYDQDTDTIRNVFNTFHYVLPGPFNDEYIKTVFIQ